MRVLHCRVAVTVCRRKKKRFRDGSENIGVKTEGRSKNEDILVDAYELRRRAQKANGWPWTAAHFPIGSPLPITLITRCSRVFMNVLMHYSLFMFLFGFLLVYLQGHDVSLVTDDLPVVVATAGPRALSLNGSIQVIIRRLGSLLRFLSPVLEYCTVKPRSDLVALFPGS